MTMASLRSLVCRMARLPSSASFGKSISQGSRLTAPTSRSFSQVARPNSSFIQQFNSRSFLTSSRVFADVNRQVQTKSDAEMSDFLRNEIQAEKESLQATGKPVQVKGFDATTDEAEVTLKKTFQNEKITVTLNVNHAVDAEAGDEAPESRRNDNSSPQDMTKMVCRPNFSVEIVKGDYTLAFNCSMMSSGENEQDDLPRHPDEENYEDMFNIDEFSIYKGEFKDSTYTMAGEVMDGSFYDNLMNMLDERGLNSDFVKEIVDFCTLYEQKLYVNLLEHLQDIVKTK